MNINKISVKRRKLQYDGKEFCHSHATNCNQDFLIKQIENTYLDKINDLKGEISNLTDILSKSEEEFKTRQNVSAQEKKELNQKLDYEIEVK